MSLDQLIKKQLSSTLVETNFQGLGKKYSGKVRDSYQQGDIRILITSDRLSCFDVVVTSIPFKGQVLNELAAFWFNKTKDIVSNHVLDVPDPNVIVGCECEILPIEVVMRGYLIGSAWRDYQAGRDVSGVRLPSGLSYCDPLPEVILTPSTKAIKGEHDQPISEKEIIENGLVEKKVWEQVKEIAFQLFSEGQAWSKEKGLILADTKYEFGLVDEKIILADEVHTLDSSRYLVIDSLGERLAASEEPEMLDKEPVRLWLLKQGYQGQGDIPEFTDEVRCQIAKRYVLAYEQITGKKLNLRLGEIEKQIEKNLHQYT